METIEIKVERKTEETRTVTLPAFRKNDFASYKVISKDDCIQVTYGKYVKPRIEMVDSSIAWYLKETEDCTEGEFQTKFNEVMEVLINKSVE